MVMKSNSNTRYHHVIPGYSNAILYKN